MKEKVISQYEKDYNSLLKSIAREAKAAMENQQITLGLLRDLPDEVFKTSDVSPNISRWNAGLVLNCDSVAQARKIVAKLLEHTPADKFDILLTSSSSSEPKYYYYWRAEETSTSIIVKPAPPRKGCRPKLIHRTWSSWSCEME